MGSGENWDSYDAKQLIDQINGGKGVGASSDVAAGWHELAGVLRQIDDTVRQGLVGAQAEWQGHASATMTSAVSPFGEWANRADEVAAQTTDKIDSLGSFYSTARNSMPTEPLINMGDHNDNIAEKVWQLVPGDHTDQEHAEAAKLAQDQAARDAMKSYDGSTYSDAQRTYFSTPPVLTAASSGPPAPSTPVPPSPTPPPWGPSDDAVPMDRDYRSVGDARVGAQSVDPVAPGTGHFSGSPNAAGAVPAGAGHSGAGQPASGAPSTGQPGSPNVAGTAPSGAGQPGAGQPGSALPGSGVDGSGVDGSGVGGTGVRGSGSGHATPEPSRAQRPGTAGTHTGSAAATSGTPGTGIRASNVSPASVEPQSDWSRGSRSPSGMDATTAGGLGMAGGTGRSSAGRSGAAGGVVRGGGYGDGLSFNGNAPFAGGGSAPVAGGGSGSGAGEGVGSGTRGGANGAGPNGGGPNGGGGPVGGGARSGGPSAGVGPSEPTTTGAGARGGAAGAGSAGRAGAGMGGMGGGGGRGNGDNDSEHETPDYLKQFDHFSDGRVISPPVIGAEPPERR